MQLLDFPLALILALAPALAGVRVAAWILPRERRLPVLLGGGAALGVGMMLFALMALLKVMPIAAAVIVAHSAFGLLAILGVAAVATRRFEWDVPKWRTVLGVALPALIFIGAGVDLASSVWNSSTFENLTVRMAMASHIARSAWRVMDVYAPDHVRLYRYASQVWVASIVRLGGVGLYEANLATVSISVLAIFGGFFAALARARSYLAGLLGGELFLTAGPANFTAFWRALYGLPTLSGA